jgi:hypothetical protein
LLFFFISIISSTIDSKKNRNKIWDLIRFSFLHFHIFARSLSVSLFFDFSLYRYLFRHENGIVDDICWERA